jgi:hypothetical protein
MTILVLRVYSVERFNDTLMNWKGFGRNWSWPNQGIFLEGFRKRIKTLSQDSKVFWPRFKPSTFSIQVKSVTTIADCSVG